MSEAGSQARLAFRSGMCRIPSCLQGGDVLTRGADRRDVEPFVAEPSQLGSSMNRCVRSIVATWATLIIASPTGLGARADRVALGVQHPRTFARKKKVPSLRRIGVLPSRCG